MRPVQSVKIDPVFFFSAKGNFRFKLARKVDMADLYRLAYLQRSLKTDLPLDARFGLKKQHGCTADQKFAAP